MLAQEHLGGSLRLFEALEHQSRWLIPCYFGMPWSNIGFRVGGVGYGGPLPLQNVTSAQHEFEQLNCVLHLLSEFTSKKCDGVTTYPAAFWESLQSSPSIAISNTRIITLPRDGTTLFDTVISGNVRTAIRKARKYGVEIRHILPDDIPIAHKLLVDTQRSVGASYTTPLELFADICCNMQTVTCTLVAIYEKSVIGVATLLNTYHYGFHQFHGWDRRFANTAANQLLIWGLLEESITAGCRFFNMGESHSAELETAKARWGSHRVPILRLSF
jgi:hypothetical protein